MRVTVDAIPLLLRSAGVKTYIWNWVRHLERLKGGDRLRLFPLIRDPGECLHERSTQGRLRTTAGIALLHAANYLGDWVLCSEGARADVFHASQQLRRPPRNALVTATIHDMTCWLLPETHTAANVAAARRFAEMVVRRAAGLIAVSENTRRDAVRILNLDPERVTVIYSGVPEAYFDAVPAPSEKPYVLFVGTIEPRKNIGTLLDAWELLRPSLRAEFDLTVAGPAGWHAGEILARLRSGIGGVRYLGYVPESEMPGLTAGATVFVYPSLYEGFGFPLAQAMASGVPAVTSAASCLPEVAGGAALLADPRSPAELAAAIERLLLSPSLRKDLGKKGRARAELYRWERCARASWDFFRRLTPP